MRELTFGQRWARAGAPQARGKRLFDVLLSTVGGICSTPLWALIAFAIKLGIVNSSSVLSNYGAKNILLSYPEVLRRIKKLRISIASKRL